jgi:glutamate-5-semialdehyde dehydrogenase
MSDLKILAQKTKEASGTYALLSENEKNNILSEIANQLKCDCEEIEKANAIDVLKAEQDGVKPSLIDRLKLNKERIYAVADAVLELISLPDPISETEWMKKRPNGILIGKRRVPLGVIGIIYEARPNVTVDAAALCLKSSNAVILRGGSAAINSNIAIVKSIKKALEKCGVNPDVVNLIEDNSRETATEMMKLNGFIDVLIPRGGAGLIKSVVENATVPVIETGTGNCHIYLDEFADLKKAVDITVNAKTQRTGVCNAAETLLIHKNLDINTVEAVLNALYDKNVEIRGCEKICKISDKAIPATDEDYYTEFLDLIISVKIVEDIDEAIAHIAKHSTSHSEAIVTENYTNANKFLNEVNSAAVYVNASTRFTDGGEFGFGAEMGISTQKLHARGPMGLKELTSYKYVIYGDGQIR